LVTQNAAQLKSADRSIEETFYRVEIRMLKKRVPCEVRVELHDEGINQSGALVVIKDVREPAADKKKVACDKGRHIVADHSIPAAFAYEGEFQFRMKMPWSTVVIALYGLTENALLLAPRNLFANGKPPLVIKVSIRWPVRDQKSPMSL
jgi:hypothetical protein